MNNYKKIIATIFLVLIPGLLISLYAQKSVELKYDVNKGDKYSSRMTTDMNFEFETNGMTMAFDNIASVETISIVQNVSSDSITIYTDINRVKSTQEMFGMEISYDSDDPSSTQNPISAIIPMALTGIANKSFSIVMDNKGKFLNSDMSQLTGNEDYVQNLSSGTQYIVYPVGNIKLGDSWDGDLVPLENSDLRVQMNYTLLKVSGKEATLGINGTITANNIDDQEINMDGTMTGEMIVDMKTGWLIKSVINQKIELDIDQGGQKFPATISGTITTTSEKLN